MNPLCVFFRRKFVAYLEEGLGPAPKRRLERHLADCRACADVLERVRAGHEAGRLFGRLDPGLPERPPEFGVPLPLRPSARRLSPPFAVGALLAAAAGLVMIFILAGREAGPPPGEGSAQAGLQGRGMGFARTAIGEFPERRQDRVVTEGFVRSVYFDEEERSLHIKLAEQPSGAGPFVICEVRDARGLAIPREGSWIRVYGQARFDAQPGREWHEVNPVMEIAVLKR
jgi:hypothetical protein